MFQKVESLSEEESTYHTKISRVQQGLEGEVATANVVFVSFCFEEERMFSRICAHLKVLHLKLGK